MEETLADAFNANSGWFDNSKKTAVHCVIRSGEAASSYTKVARDFVREFVTSSQQGDQSYNKYSTVMKLTTLKKSRTYMQ